MTRLLTPILAAAVFAPVPALAHLGGLHEAGGVVHGLLHPLTGPDHLLAMLAVGVWAALCGGQAVRALPAAFVLAMLAGFGLGRAGLAFPAVEPVILASVIVTGALVALAVRLPLGAAVALVAVFALAHGQAHGTEAPATGIAAYAAGFTLATAALLAAGLALGFGLARAGREALARALGGAAALGGMTLAFL
jgi:urease accessory protein